MSLYALMLILVYCNIHSFFYHQPSFPQNDASINYYVDPSSISVIEDGSIKNPWKTIAQVNHNMDKFQPGDHIYFRKGQHLKGHLVIYCSGTFSAPIVFSTYGKGEEPVLEYDSGISKPSEDRTIIDISKANYIVLDGFKLTDSRMNLTDHVINALVGTGIDISESSFITIKNMNISLVGIGISVRGNNNKIDSCIFNNMRMVVNDKNADNDYGSNGIVLSGSNNEITHNFFSDNWATSFDYNYDGGAIEFFGPYSNNKILYNTCINNEGFIEFGSRSNGTAENNLIAFNLLINNGMITYINNNGKFSLKVLNLQFYNNNVIETVRLRSKVPYLFSSTTQLSPKTLFLKNNIFYLNRDATIAKITFTSNAFIHTNNIYNLSDHSATGFSLSSNELSVKASAQIFANTSSPDPANWDYNLSASSPAISFGTYFQTPFDLKGNRITKTILDAGAVQRTAQKN